MSQASFLLKAAWGLEEGEWELCSVGVGLQSVPETDTGAVSGLSATEPYTQKWSQCKFCVCFRKKKKFQWAGQWFHPRKAI